MPLDSPLPSLRVDADFWSLRFVDETSENYTVRKNVALPLDIATECGVMATVYADGGYGYAATGDTSPAGLRRLRSRGPASGHAPRRGMPSPIRRRCPAPPHAVTSVSLPLAGALSRRAWFDLLAAESAAAAIDPRIVDWEAAVEVRTATHRLVTSEGGDVIQRYRFVMPNLSVTAFADGDAQTRTPERCTRHLPAGRPGDPGTLRVCRRRWTRRGRSARTAGRAQLSCRARWTCCSRPTR